MGETPKAVKHDTDSLKAENCSFHDSRGHVTLHCLTLKRHLEDLMQRGYLDEFVLNSAEDPEVGRAPSETVD